MEPDTPPQHWGPGDLEAFEEGIDGSIDTFVNNFTSAGVGVGWTKKKCLDYLQDAINSYEV